MKKDKSGKDRKCAKRKSKNADNNSLLYSQEVSLGDQLSKDLDEVQYNTKQEDGNTNELSSQAQGFMCRASDLMANVADDDSFIEFVNQLEDRVMKQVIDGEFTFSPAVVGYDMYSDAVIYDYDMMMQVLTANGYCAECADTFINAFAFWDMSDKKNEFKPQNIVLVRKEQVEVNAMRAEFKKKSGKQS